jgi:hypothetical protein
MLLESQLRLSSFLTPLLTTAKCGYSLIDWHHEYKRDRHDTYPADNVDQNKSAAAHAIFSPAS